MRSSKRRGDAFFPSSVSAQELREADLFWASLTGQRGGSAREDQEDAGEATCVAPDLPTILQALDDKVTPALFEWVRVSCGWNDPTDATKFMSGVFWMFSDAMMVELPNDAKWGFWKGTSVEQPLPQNPIGATIKDRKRLVRLPCTGKDAQATADRLLFSQAELNAADNGAFLGLPAPTSADKRPSLLPTAELWDACYANASVRIPPQPVALNNCLADNALSYAEKVASAIAAAPNAASTTPRLLGTPGKIWAIADRMDTWVWCTAKGMEHWSYACINHGFHSQLLGNDRFGRPTVKAIQVQGGCHNWFHLDYSQIFSAVAGWCLAKRVGESRAQWRPTADVYTDPELCKLVRASSPVPATRYVGNVTNSAQPATHP